MKRFTSFSFLLIFVIKMNAQPAWLWAQNAQTTEDAHPTVIAVDQQGNSYVAGTISTQIAQPSIHFGSLILTNSNNFDDTFFIVKYNSSGIPIWVKGIPTYLGSIHCTGLKLNNSENGFYITGRIYAQNAIFGNDTVSSRDYQDLFISKFDTSGQSQWVKLCTTPSGSTEYIRGESLYLDPADNLYVTGWFSHQRMVIDSITLLNNSGYAAMFVAKFNSNGNVIWAKKGGSTVWGGGSASGYTISVDPGGDVYISGTCFGTSLYFDTSLAVNPSGSSGIFLSKFDSGGHSLWAQVFEGTADVRSLTCDASGAVYCTGGFSSSSLQFGSNILTNASATISDVFIAKFNSTGAVAWAQRAGGSSDDAVRGAVTDGQGNLIITGYFASDSILFGSKLLINNLAGSSVHIPVFFLTKINSAGTTVWAENVPGSSYVYGTALSLSATGNLYVTGEFGINASFGASNISNSGTGYEMFLAKKDINTGIQEDTGFNSNADVHTFPNPVRNTLRIWTPDINPLLFLRVYNVAGVLIMSVSEVNLLKQNYEINTSNLTEGVYIMEITTRDGVVIKKLVKE